MLIKIKNPAITICDSIHETMDESLIHYAVEAGALLIDGFCNVDVKLLGPAHEYEVPPLDERFSATPWQTGLLLEAVAVGFALIVTDVVANAVHPDALVTVTV